MRKFDNDPIMCIPNDVYMERDRIAKSRWRNAPYHVLLEALKFRYRITKLCLLKRRQWIKRY